MLYNPPSQVLDFNGNPSSGAKLTVYKAGTSTPTTIYADSGLSTPLPNPLIADSGGYLPAYYTAIENLKLVLTNAQDVQIYTVDPAAGIRLAQVTSGISDTATTTQLVITDTDRRINQPFMVGDVAQAPKARLHVLRGLAEPPGTATPPAGADALMIEGDANTGLTIFTPNSDEAAVNMGVPADGSYAALVGKYDGAGSSLQVFVDNQLVGTFKSTSKPVLDVYESPEQDITSAGSLTLPHGLSSRPRWTEVELVCKSADQGFIANDRFTVGPNMTSGTSGRGVVVVQDATNLRIRYGADSSVFESLNFSSGASFLLDNTKWKAIFYAFR